MTFSAHICVPPLDELRGLSLVVIRLFIIGTKESKKYLCIVS